MSRKLKTTKEIDPRDDEMKDLKLKRLKQEKAIDPRDDEIKNLRLQRAKVSLNKALEGPKGKEPKEEWGDWTRGTEKKYGTSREYSYRVNRKTGERERKD